MAVAYRDKSGREAQVRAKREIVLSAGAIGSPQILMLSGIGEAEQLKQHGIAVLRDAPAVGQGLQDHLQACLVFKCNEPTLKDEVRSLATAFLKARPEVETPDIQFHIQPWSADSPGEGVHPFSAFSAPVCQLRPESRGEIRLFSLKPEDYPTIHPNYLATETDCETLLAGIKIARNITSLPPLVGKISEEHQPGPGVESDEELLEWARNTSTTIYHPTGTCRMGPDPAAVVDPRLRVQRVEVLRIADCSIMPEIVSGNTNAPAIMIGGKAARMILEDTTAKAA